MQFDAHKHSERSKLAPHGIQSWQKGRNKKTRFSPSSVMTLQLDRILMPERPTGRRTNLELGGGREEFMDHSAYTVIALSRWYKVVLCNFEEIT